MENGRIEPLRALPVHREAQPCLQPPQWAKYIQCTLFFFLMDAHIFSDLLGGPLKGSWPLAAANLRELLEALEAPWRPVEAPGGPWRPGPVFLFEGEDDLFEVGIEGVALNPNRK